MGRGEKSRWLFGGAALGVLIAGGLLTLWSARQADRQVRSQLLVQAAAIANQINIEHLRGVSSTTPGQNIVHRHILQSQINDYRQALMALSGRTIQHLTISSLIVRNGALVSGLDTTGGVDSPAAASTTAFQDFPADLQHRLQSGIPWSAGPHGDADNAGISAFAPVVDPVSSAPVLVIRMDMAAADWRAFIVSRAIPHALFSVGALLSIALLFFLNTRRRCLPAERRGWFLRYADVLLAGCAGMLFVGILSHLAHNTEMQNRNDAFMQQALSESAAVGRTMHEISENQLEGLARFFESSRFVERGEFNTFAQYLMKNPAVQAWCLVSSIAAGELDAFEKTVRQECGRDFAVWENSPPGTPVPEAPHAHYYPVTYVEPFDTNTRLLGCNLGAVRQCRDAMERSLETGMSMGTEPVPVAPDQGGGQEIFIFRPADCSVLQTDRTCFAAAALRFQPFPARTGRGEPASKKSMLISSMYGLQAGRAPVLLATFPPGQSGPVFSGAQGVVPFLRPVFAFGKAYAVAVRPGPMFLALYPVKAARQTALFGLAATALLVVFTFFLNRRSALLERQVMLRTRELSESNRELQETAQRLEHILRVTKTRIDIVDAGFNFRYVDSQWQNAYGDPAGRTCYEYFMGRDTPCPACPIPEAFRTKQIAVTEEILPHEDNRVDRVQIIPFEGPDGEWLAAKFNVDITEQKQAEEDLRSSRNLLNELEHISLSGGWVHSVRTGQTTWSDELYRLLGYAPGEVPLTLDVYCNEHVHPDDRTTVQSILGNPDGAFSPAGYEYRIITRAGDVLFVHAQNKAERDADGNVVRLYGTVTDVTLRRQTEAELRKSKEFLENVFKTTGDGLIVSDETGIILRINDRAAHMLGYREDELAGKMMSMILADPNSAAAACKHPIFGELLLKGFVENYESEFRRKDGTAFLAETNIITMKDDAGNMIGSVGSIRDITDRKKTEKELHESRDFLKTVIESSRDGIIICDPRGEILLVNKAVEDMCGFSNEELKGSHVSMLVVSDAEVRRQVLQSTAELFQKGYARYETVHRAKNGRLIFVECISSMIQDDRGEYIAGVSILRDVSERKRLEQQLRNSQKMEAIGTLAGGIAHDFNNILAAILGYAELCLPGTAEDTQQRYYIQQIVTSSTRAKDLVKQILAFSRKDQEEKKPLDLSVLVTEALKLLRASLPVTIEIRDNAREVSCIVQANQTQMHQVLMNLVTNAAQAMSENGGILEVHMKPAVLHHADLADHPDLVPGLYVDISVSDTGEGIDPENIDRIFEPFFTTKGVGSGTGMGLALVHGIVKSHGGDIRVESRKGSGTVFHVLLPRVDTIPASGEMDSALPESGTERILFVDDDRDLVDIGKSQLESLGYTVTATCSSSEALELFARDPAGFDLVITDQTMPHLTGDVLAEKLIAIRSDIPILLCTGFSEKITEETAAAIGIQALLLKPVTFRKMSEVIRNVLAR